jgi:serine protease Do
VVADARVVSVRFPDGQRMTVTRWSEADAHDLALLHLPTSAHAPPVTVSDGRVLGGDLVGVVGYPLGGELTTGQGRVLDVTPSGGGLPRSLIASVEILPGNSGGPLLSVSGDLVGVIRAIDLRAGSAIAVPAHAVRSLVEQGDAADDDTATKC